MPACTKGFAGTSFNQCYKGGAKEKLHLMKLYQGLFFTSASSTRFLNPATGFPFAHPPTTPTGFGFITLVLVAPAVTGLALMPWLQLHPLCLLASPLLQMCPLKVSLAPWLWH